MVFSSVRTELLDFLRLDRQGLFAEHALDDHARFGKPRGHGFGHGRGRAPRDARATRIPAASVARPDATRTTTPACPIPSAARGDGPGTVAVVLPSRPLNSV